MDIAMQEHEILRDPEIEYLRAKVAELEAQLDRVNRECEGLARQLTHERNKCGFIKVCHWNEDEEGHWFGKCGIGWTFNDLPSSPMEHHMRYCPQCSAEIIQHDYKAKEDER